MNYNSNVHQTMQTPFHQPSLFLPLQQGNITTSESQLQPKPKLETTGQKCTNCGHPVKPATKARPQGYRVCSCCKDFKFKYGFVLTFEDRAFLNSKQFCNICGTAENLCVDHDHTTNKIRGYLCHNCNFGIGLFQDDLQLLQAAINYLSTNGSQI